MYSSRTGCIHKVCVASGASKPNAKLKAAVQLFTIAEFSIVGTKIVGAHVLQTNHKITKDIKKYYLACAICEVVSQLEGAGFLLTARALEKLDEGGTPREIFTQYFSELLKELGYDTEPDESISTSFLRYLDIEIPNTKSFL